MRHAKIVCTLGPAVAGFDAVLKLAEAGMDVARLNFSHGDHATHAQAFAEVRRAAQDLKRPIAVLADLCGPKIRLGDIEGGQAPIEAGQSVTITTRPVLGSQFLISTNYVNLPREVKSGGRVFIDDGMLELAVVEVHGDEVVCRVVNGGTLRSRKGLNLPDAELSTPAVTEKDRRDIEFGRQLGVNYFALSFVRLPQDVLEAKAASGGIPIIAKIEKPSAVEHLEAIADVADGLMVARGDLGIEVGPEKVPLLQKRMIAAMNRRAKPVITATQMLESMVQNPHPTRAEVSDVANAILDGTDAVMLSAETAAGKHPVAAVQAMDRIIREVESVTLAAGARLRPSEVAGKSFPNAIAHAAAQAALDLNFKAVAVYSDTGRSIALVSAYRPASVIAGFVRRPEILPRLALHWGVVPLFGEYVQDADGAVYQAERELRRLGLLQPGDEIAVTFGMDDGIPAGTTIMRLWKARG